MAVNSQVQILRGSTANASLYVGKIGELVYDIGKKTIRALDGATAGGTPLAKEEITFSTDSEALLLFNADASADLSTDIEITLDTAKVADKVADEIADDGDIAKKIAASLVSSKADNGLSVASGTGEDGLLFVTKQEVDGMVATGEQLIYVKTEGTDKKLATNLKIEYTASTGKLAVYGGSAGTTKIGEVEIPTALTVLKKAETVVNPSGKPAGTYMHFVFETQSGTDNEVYLSANDFDIYTAGDGLKLNASDDHKIEASIASTGNQLKLNDSKEMIVPTDYGTLD